MKKIKLLAFLAVFVLAVTSCKKDDENNDEEEQNSEFYISYKANGVQITQTEVFGSRGTSPDGSTLSITGNEKEGKNPKFKFFTTETFIGFNAGLNVGSSRVSSDNHYVEFTNSAGLLHTTALTEPGEGMSVGFFELTYSKDGIAKGVFEGNVKAQNGSTVVITDGEFRIKFSN